MERLEEAQRLLRPYTIWVLAPSLESDDPNLQYYYDFTQSILEYKDVFAKLDCEWKWQPVTINNYKAIIAAIAHRETGKEPLVLNLCDGDEVNGTPGISVIHELEKHRLIYTGARAFFYKITTSKIPMKRAFNKASVPTPNWRIIQGNKPAVKGICNRVGSPLIIKPAVSGGSMGVSVKNVVETETELLERVSEIQKGYRGWNLLADGLFVEQYVTGREFTTFITGSFNDAASCIVYEPVERVFHPSLPAKERFLSFDRLWEIYEDESAMPQNENFYEYQQLSDPALVQRVKELSLQAFTACRGTGYGRLDFRLDEQSGQLLVLEVNAQCGLSEDENYTSIGAILKTSNVTFTEVVVEILKDALRHSMQAQPASASNKRKKTLQGTKKATAG